VHDVAAAVVEIDPLASNVGAEKDVWRSGEIEGELDRLAGATAVLVVVGVAGQVGNPVNAPARPPGLFEEVLTTFSFGFGLAGGF
jgi:hypothetical protein